MMRELELVWRQASAIRRSVSHWCFINITSHRLVQSPGLHVQQARLEASLARHRTRIQRVAQDRVQVLDLVVAVDRVAEEILTLADFARQLVSQCVDLLLERLDTLAVVLFASLKLTLGLLLGGADALYF